MMRDGVEREGDEQPTTFQTALKQKTEQEASKDLMLTPSPLRRHCYRPANIRLLSQMQQVSEDSITYVLIAKIDSISNEPARYWISLNDQTQDKDCLLAYCSKSGSSLSSFLKKSEESVEQLQYQANREDGQPYFKLWIRQTEPGWYLEKVQRIRDHNQLSFHWLAVIQQALLPAES